MNNLEINERLIKESCDCFGAEDTSITAMEECSELIQCISKQLRCIDNRKHMEEEIGDVLIAVSDLIYIYDLDKSKIQWWIDFKQKRQVDRIVELDKPSTELIGV